MATWRKVITSGSRAHLKSLVTATGIEVPAGIDAANPANISASAIFASSSNGGDGTGDINKIAIVDGASLISASNEVFYTSSAALTTTVNELTFGDGISGSLITATSTGWDGSTAGTINIDTASLADDGLTGALTANKIAVDISSLAGAGSNRNLAFDGDNGNRLDIDVLNTGIQGFGTTATAQFSTDGLAIKVDSSTTSINGSNQLVGTIPGFLGKVTEGNGIGGLGSGYDGSQANVALRIDNTEINGTGLTTNADASQLTINTGSGAALTANSALIFNGTSFITSSIVEDSSANTIRVGKADGTTSVSTSDSDLVVEGTFKASDENNFSVKDKFVLINSGSNVGAANASFGFVGEVSATDGIGWNLKSRRWTMTTGSLGTNGQYGGEVGAIPLVLGTADIGTTDVFDLKKGNMMVINPGGGAPKELYIYAPTA